MKILIITTQDVFFLSHIEERARYFKARGCEIAVAAQQTSSELVNQIRSKGYHFYDTKIERKSINPISQCKGLIRLLRINLQFKPDVVYNLGAKAIFYGTLTSRIINKKVGILNAPIGLGYVYASDNLRAKLLKPVVFLLYRYFLNPKKSRVIIENFDDINYFVRNKCLDPKDAFCILGAGVDTNHFHPLPLAKRNANLTVVMASRLIKEKGVMDYVKAAQKLYENQIPVRMQLVGKPDYGNPSSVTEDEFKQIKECPYIEYLGYQNDIAPILQSAHVCCLPSYYREGLPRVLIEGASSGLAILTTDTIGCREVIREENGYLIQVHDIEMLVSNITYLAQHITELEYMCAKSREVALKYFDTTIICKRTYEILKSLDCS